MKTFYYTTEIKKAKFGAKVGISVYKIEKKIPILVATGNYNTDSCMDRGWIVRNDCIWAKRNGINVVKYSSELLRQFDAASDRAIEIYGKERIEYTTSMTNARIAFISLIEKGMLIKLTRKHNYMINPMMVFTYNHRIFLEKRCQQSYMAILKSADGDNELIKKGLREYCDKVQATYEKEIERTNNINRNRSLEI